MRLGITGLFVIAVALCSIAEVAARFSLNHISRLHQRIVQERAAAQAVRPGLPGQPPTMLFVGNSLLLAGVDFPQLVNRTASRFRVSRFVVEQTNYYDWYYATAHLLRKGARPDYLLLCLNPRQLSDNAIRGEFSARFLFGLEDIWPAARAARADLTTTSGLYLAHFSTFYASRAELRGLLMGKIAPQVPQLSHDLVPAASGFTIRGDQTPVFAGRLQACAELCDMYHVKFLFLVPPTRQIGDDEISRAGQEAHVEVLRPVPNLSLGPEYYSDGFHLNEAGANIITLKVANEILHLSPAQ
jgi:hypothetical protein